MKAKGKALVKIDALAQLKSWLSGFDRKELIQNGVIIGAFLIFILFFFFPFLARNRQMSQDVSQLTAQVRNAGLLIAKLPEMKKQKEIFGARMEKIRKQFFTPEEAKQLIEIISTTASQSKVRITATQPGTKEAALPEPFQQLYRISSYELTVEGSYHGLGSFINRLEQHSKNFAVPEFKMTENKEAPAVHKAVLVVDAFMERYTSGMR